MAKKGVASLSGGIDSTTLVYDLVSQGWVLDLLGWDYGQRHKGELEFGKKTAKKLRLRYQVVDISSIHNLLKSSLTHDMKIPKGHYAEESMKSTVVPNRNLIFLSLASGYAMSHNIEDVFYGAHAGDHAIYPDCREEFVKAAEQAFNIGNWSKVKIYAPYINITKAEIVKRGLELKVPYKNTTSCYEGKERPCLKCGTDVERTEAFYLNNTQDPLLTKKEWKSAVEYMLKEREKFEKTK